MSINLKLWHIIVGIVLAMYPFNYCMMRAGVGFYDNNPNSTWVDGSGDERKTYHGPCYENRAIALIISPLIAPANAMDWLAQTTGPKGGEDQPSIEVSRK